MPPVKTPALILHTFPYGDTSRILRILTPELGVRSVIAKGARTPKSRFGGILEPFSEGEAQFNLREGAELYTLTGFSLIRSRQGIGRDLSAFAGASVLAEITLHAGTEEASPALFRLVQGALDRLAEAREEPATIIVPALWSLVTHLGFRPEMRFCVRCGEPLSPSEIASFDAEAGGTVCSHCGSSGPPLHPATRDAIDRMCDEDAVPLDAGDLRSHLAALAALVRTHVVAGRSLRSLPLLLEQLR